jgi:acetylornithine deacetylase/succinyl-diaminopimelate desuccinylase-like protein
VISTTVAANPRRLIVMLRSVLLLLAFAIASPLVSINSVSADEIVRYRLEDWKRKHIHDLAKADRIADTLKKLGCEVEKADHNGHVDVKYRCPQWRQIKLNNHDEVDRWQRWFREYYFQTEHKH